VHSTCKYATCICMRPRASIYAGGSVVHIHETPHRMGKYIGVHEKYKLLSQPPAPQTRCGLTSLTGIQSCLVL
jgi:hypothetical protein